jgi:hypothetical protein
VQLVHLGTKILANSVLKESSISALTNGKARLLGNLILVAYSHYATGYFALISPLYLAVLIVWGFSRGEYFGFSFSL